MIAFALEDGGARRIMHVADEGPRDAPVLVFANSLGTDFRVWGPLLPHLPPGLRVIRYDMPGHGLSDLAGDRPIEAHAEDLRRLLDGRGLGLGSDRVVLVGLSVGGMIAQAFAAAHPDRLTGLVLCDTGHRIGTSDLWNARIEAVGQGGVDAIADGVLERWFSPRFHRDDAARLALWRAMLTRTPAAGYIALSRAIRDADLTEAARAIKTPTVAIGGELDGSTPPTLMQEMTSLIDGARFELLPGVGHIPPVEAPEALSRLISEFLREIGCL